MFSNRRGFSLIEIVVTLLAGSVLMGIAAPSISGVRGHFAVTGARTTFSSLQARARAQAIERGGTVRLVVDADRESVALWSGAERLEIVDFATEFNVDIRATSAVVSLCMTARGFADPDCNSFTEAPKITFWQGADSASVTILPMGQLVF